MAFHSPRSLSCLQRIPYVPLLVWDVVIDVKVSDESGPIIEDANYAFPRMCRWLAKPTDAG